MMTANLGRMLGLVLLVGTCLLGGASAQDYPNKTITLVVPFSPGGGSDLTARMLVDNMTKDLGQTVVVENMPGGSTIIAADYVAKAEPDGYTLLLGSSSLSINAVTHADLPYDTLADLAPISMVARGPLLLVVNAQSDITSLDELVAKAQANPGRLTYSSTGVSSAMHLRMQMISDALEIDLIHVPYQGAGNAQVDLLGGHIDMMLTSMVSAVPLIESGSIRPLVITSLERFPSLPDVPAISEAIPGYETWSWFALYAPNGTPEAVLDRLNTSAGIGLSDPALIETLARDGSVAMPSTRQVAEEYLRDEIGTWTEVLPSIE